MRFAAWAFASDAGVSRRVRTAGVLLAGVVLGWEGSAVVLVNPFLLQWTLTTAAVILTLGFVVRLKESGSNGYLSAVIWQRSLRLIPRETACSFGLS